MGIKQKIAQILANIYSNILDDSFDSNNKKRLSACNFLSYCHFNFIPYKIEKKEWVFFFLWLLIMTLSEYVFVMTGVETFQRRTF